MMNTNAPVPTPAPKKGRGCIIALVVAGVIGGLTLLVVGVAVFVFLRSDKGQKVVKFASESKTLMEEAENAPGAKELSNGICTRGALVFDMKKLEKVGQLGQALASDAGPAAVKSSARVQVMCTVADTASAPSCEDVASAYIKAVGEPGGDFIAAVNTGFSPKLRCAKLFSATGELVGSDHATE